MAKVRKPPGVARASQSTSAKGANVRLKSWAPLYIAAVAAVDTARPMRSADPTRDPCMTNASVAFRRGGGTRPCARARHAPIAWCDYGAKSMRVGAVSDVAWPPTASFSRDLTMDGEGRRRGLVDCTA